MHDHPSLPAALASLAEPAPPGVIDRVAAALELGNEFVAVDAPVGRLYAAFSQRGVSMVWLGGDEEEFRQAFHSQHRDRPLRRATAAPRALVAALAEGRGARSLRYDIDDLSPFQRAVLNKTAEIPRGEVRPYGWVAREVGQPGAVRAVGTALGRNPIPVLIPCHRVVRSDGRIGEYALGSPVKQQLLRWEGLDLDELSRLASVGGRYVGSTTTSVYCLPTCHAARRINRANRRTFRSAGEAADAGFRPCRHCRPAA